MLYQTMYYVGMIMMILMFIISVILFIKLNIYKVVGDLTGISAKRAINNKRQYNAKSGAKSYHTSEINKERGKLTDKIFLGTSFFKNTGNMGEGNNVTRNLAPKLEENLDPQGTMVLQNTDETTVLSQNQKANSEYYLDIDFDLMLINTSESI